MKKNSILCTLMCLVSLGSLASCGSKTSGSTGSGNTAKPSASDTVKPEPEPAKKDKPFYPVLKIKKHSSWEKPMNI